MVDGGGGFGSVAAAVAIYSASTGGVPFVASVQPEKSVVVLSGAMCGIPGTLSGDDVDHETPAETTRPFLSHFKNLNNLRNILIIFYARHPGALACPYRAAVSRVLTLRHRTLSHYDHCMWSVFHSLPPARYP